MRTFIAIDLPREVKDKIAKLEKDLAECGLDFKWVKPENLHLTLKFLGNIDEDKIKEIKPVVAKIAAGFAWFEAGFDDFGFFPNQRKPRVFFISTTQKELLKSIAVKMEDGLENLGFVKENRFRPHITLARIKDIKNIGCLKRKIENIRLDKEFPVEGITLYKSTLTKEGPVYEEIFKSRFEK